MEYKINNLSDDINLDVKSIEITNSNNFSIEFYTYGGYFHSVRIPYRNNINITEDVLLGYKKFSDNIIGHGCFNSIVGRVTGRIGHSKFKLNGVEYNLYKNDKDHHIHGGKEGFNKKNWSINNIEQDKDKITVELQYISKHLEENYPGNLNCSVFYTLNNNNELIIQYQAISDKDTIINLTNHNYWNFHGHNEHYKNITDHEIIINSLEICEFDDNLIPTGKIKNIKDSFYDFSKQTNTSQQLLDNGGIDNFYIINKANNESPCAIAYSNLTRMGVEYYTNQEGIVFYTGNMMKDKYEGKYNREYGLNYGLCFETQNYPDAINQKNFPSIVLYKNQKYYSFTKIKLKNNF